MRQRIINWLLKKVVRISRPNDVMRQNGGICYLGNTPISKEEIKTLVSEAKALESMRLWSIINETLKQRIYDKGWVNSTTIEHLNIAKAEYAILDTQDSIVRVIRKMV